MQPGALPIVHYPGRVSGAFCGHGSLDMEQEEHSLRCTTFYTMGPLECCLNPVSSHHSKLQQHQKPGAWKQGAYKTRTIYLLISGAGYGHMLAHMASPIFTLFAYLPVSHGVEGC